MTANQKLVSGLVLGFAVGSCWMYMHMSCPTCQSKFDWIKRHLGLKLIE